MTIDTSTKAMTALTKNIRTMAQAEYPESKRELYLHEIADRIDALLADRNTKEAERAELWRKHRERCGDLDVKNATCETLRSDLAALRAENEVLKKALEPFAASLRADTPGVSSTHFLAARAALSTKEPNL